MRLSADQLAEQGARWRSEGRRVVWTNGCFDLLHVGHVRSLEQARALGDVLVVGVNGDGSVRRLKGDGRPIVPAGERAEIVAALRAVDAVVVFDDDTPAALVALLRPHLFCKGSDYEGRDVPEAEAVRSYGGVVEFLDMVPGLSTSATVSRIERSGLA